MTLDFSKYLQGGGLAFDLLNDVPAAVGVDYMLDLRQGQDVILTRQGVTDPLPAQRVVVAPLNGTTVTENAGPSGRTGVMDVVLIGLRDHPTKPDFNVQRGDKFRIGTALFEVFLVDTTMAGKIEARAKAIQ